MGHDTHRLAIGGPLLLGGVAIPHDKHLVGHSDADVLLHAITDALLGASGLDDIGQLFPDDDPAHRGRDSSEILRTAMDQVRAFGFELVNADCVISAQAPRVAPWKIAIRERVAGILQVPPDRINLKAKTGERVGPIGREEAITARCVALLRLRDTSGLSESP